MKKLFTLFLGLGTLLAAYAIPTDDPILQSATVNVLVPSDCNMDVSNGMWLCWYPEGKSYQSITVKMEDKGGRHYEAAIEPKVTSFTYYVINRSSTGVSGVHRTYTRTTSKETNCAEVIYNSSNYHTLYPADCSAADHDYTPTNMVATPLSKDTVQFSWDMKDAPTDMTFYGGDANGNETYLGSYTYDAKQGNTCKVAINAGKKTTYAYWKISVYESLIDSYVRFANKGNGFTVEGSEYVPSNLTVSKNGSNYIISWHCDGKKEGKVDHYRLNVQNADTYTDVLTINKQYEEEYTLTTLAANTNYSCHVVSYDAENNYLGDTYVYFSTESVASHDLSVYVYIPQAAGIPSVEGFYVQWRHHGYKENTVDIVSEGNNWYRADLKGLTQTDVYLSVMNAAKEEDATINWTYNSAITKTSYFILNKDIKGELKFSTIHKSYYPYDFCAYNVNAEVSAGQVTVSFETNEEAEKYYIGIYDEYGTYMNGRTCYTSDEDFENGVTFYFNNSESVKYMAGVRPTTDEGYYSDAAFVYSPFVEVPTSPYVIRNAKAEDNGDGTFTLSWDPILDADVAYYYVYVFDPNDSYVSGAYVYGGAQYTTPLLTLTGDYYFYVTPYDMQDEYHGSTETYFTVDPVPSRDIKVRALIHKDSGYDKSGGLTVTFYSFVNSSSVNKAATLDGDWFEAKYNTTDRAVRVGLGSSSFTIAKDTCFQLFPGDEWDYAPCDAEAQDHRIPQSSLKAVSKAGRAEFTWSAPTKSDNYEIKLFDALDLNTPIAYYDVTDLPFQYPVPESYDGMEVVWQVRPYSPHTLDWTPSTQSITLQKGDVEISNLKTTTDNDSVNLTLSWECNKPDLKYELWLYHDSYVCKHDTASTTSYAFTAPANGEYNWYVRALDPADKDGILTEWYSSSKITLNKVPDPITNPKATANGTEVTFSWDRTSEDVVCYLEVYRMENGSYTHLFDTLVTSASWTYNTERDGYYAANLYANFQYESGKYNFLQYVGLAGTQVFNGKTYKLTVTAEEGGHITPMDMSGNYGEGYKVQFSVSADYPYRFVGWSDGSMDYYRLLIMDHDYTLTARFEIAPKHTLKVEASEGGSIEVDGDKYDASYEGEVYEFSYMNVEAVPKDGYGFYQWSDGVTDADRYISLTSDSTIKAIFKPLRTVTLGTAANGKATYKGDYVSVNGSTYTVLDGTIATLIATPNTGYKFKTWGDGTDFCIFEREITSNQTFTPSFEAAGSAKQYTVKVSATTGGTCTEIDGTYYEGTKFQLNAHADEGYTFIGWSNGMAGSPMTLTVTANVDLSAEFTTNKYKLTVNTNGNGKFTVSGGTRTASFTQEYEYGTSISLKAYPDKHYHFKQWSDGNSNTNRSFTVQSDMTITAEFEIDQYMITFLNDNGSYLEAKQWNYGETPSCSITPTKAETDQYTYSFDGWNPAITAVTKEQIYKAVFKSTEKGGGSGEGGEGEKGLEQTNEEMRKCENAKILYDGQIYILRGEKVYTATGLEVK